MTKLEQLERQAQEAQDVADKARDELRRIEAERQARRDKRVEAHERKLLADYKDSAYEAAVREADEQLRTALRETPFIKAAIEAGYARRVRYEASAHARGLASRFGERPVPLAPNEQFALDPIITHMVEQVAADMLHARMAERAAELEAAAEGK